MGCPDPIDEVHPQHAGERAALTALEAHARRCGRCAARLERARTVDRALAALVADVDPAPGACPCPEALVAWIASGGARPAGLDGHLVRCVGCRADLLVASRARASSERATSSRRVVARSSTRRGRLVELEERRSAAAWPARVVAAALIVLGAGLGLHAARDRGPTRVADARPAPPPLPLAAPRAPGDAASSGGGDDASTGRGSRVFDAPADEVDDDGDAAGPGDEPAPAGDRAAAESTTAAEDEVPEAAASADAPVAAREAREPRVDVVAVALPIASSDGVRVRLPGEGSWRPLEGTSVPGGATLRASSRGGVLELGSDACLYLGPGSRLTVDATTGALALVTGPVLYEGQDELVLEHALGRVTASGRALVAGRREAVAMASLIGRLRFDPGAEGAPQVEVQPGHQALATARGLDAPRPLAGAADGSVLPGWFHALRPELNPDVTMPASPGVAGERPARAPDDLPPGGSGNEHGSASGGDAGGRGKGAGAAGAGAGGSGDGNGAGGANGNGNDDGDARGSGGGQGGRSGVAGSPPGRGAPARRLPAGGGRGPR